MKEQTFINNFRTFFYLISLFLLFIGCKKDSGSSAGEAKGSLVFRIEGIVPVQEEYGKQASVDGKSSYISLSTDYQKLGNVDLGIETAVDNMSTSFGESSSSLKDRNSKILSKLAATTVDMAQGIKYVILLYNKTTRRTEFIGQATVGQSLVIDAVKGQEYDWVAYSYNNSDDITLPTSIDEAIDTPTDSELLYASGTISTTVSDKPIPIVFQHKLAQIVFEIDYDRLFGKINTDVVLSFVEGNNPLTKGKLSLKTGQTSDIVSYTKPIVLEQDPNDENIRIIRFYVVDLTKSPSFGIKVSNLKVKYLNNVEDQLVEPGVFRNAQFNWVGNLSLGKRYVAKLKLWYVFPQRTILHVNTSYPAYGYAAAPYINGTNYVPSSNKASYNMISEPKNYGLLSESIVRSGGFKHLLCHKNNELNFFLEGRYKPAANPVTTPDLVDSNLPVNPSKRPDIVIISVYYLMDEDDRTALISYINGGGVVLLMTDGIRSNERTAQQPFFRDFFKNQTITLQNTGYSSGALYRLKDIDDEILNGPFGDLRLKYWGEDASPTTSLSNVPSSEITEYSDAKALNGTKAANGVTMFKHKTKHFFWIGDGGFLSNERARGIYSSNTIEPFATVDLSQSGSSHPIARYNYNNYPIPKKYGYNGNGISAGSTDVYNSTVFANIMSWAVINAEFFGVNTGGLKKILPGAKDWELSKDSVNINF